MSRRVVVTGMGVISPVGNDIPSFWDALTAGRSGIGPITRFDASKLGVRIAGELKGFDPLDHMDKKEARRMDRYSQYAMAACREAISAAGLQDRRLGDRTAVIVGTGIGGIETLLDQHSTFLERGPSRVSPFFIPMMISNIAAGQISITFGAKGPNATIVTACASGAHAIGEAFRVLSRGEADVAITGGSEAPLVAVATAGFVSMRALSVRNDEPERASRPFDRDRDGFVIAEGAGMLVLETLEHAVNRGASIVGEILGYGSTADAYHISAPAPDGDGGMRAMSAALGDAGMKPAAVDYINAHGTSTPLNDVLETVAIKRVFQDHANRLVISSTKSMTGHLLGAAGGVECIASLLTIQTGIVPPTINLENPDPECDLDYTPNHMRKMEVRTAMSNSFGFGGQNACLVVGRRPW